MNSVITYIKENKIKTLLGICAISSIIYYGKKNYTKIKNFYELTKEFVNFMKNNNGGVKPNHPRYYFTAGISLRQSHFVFTCLYTDFTSLYFDS